MLGKSQLQACPAKVMLFPGIPQSCPALGALQALQGGRGPGKELLVWPPQQPLALLSHSLPAPLAGHLEPTATANISAVLPFFCPLPQSILQALWNV